MVKKLLNRKEQEAFLCSRTGEPVNFKYPEPPYLLEGKLLDRCVSFVYEDNLVAYWNVIDFIRFEGEDEDWLRITYYRYKKAERKWVFAGQTSMSNPISGFLELFVKVVKEKDWIRPLFREVYKQCSKELSREK